MLSYWRLRQLLYYNPENGWFINRHTRGQRALVGTRTGTFDKDGYRMISIDRSKYRAGRLAWFYTTGEWPIEIEHWNGVRDDDSWNNLRDATRSQNICNSEREVGISGLRGVKLDPKTSTWRARIQYGYLRSYLGPFDTKEEAYEAYLEASSLAHGEFALHKRNLSLGGQ